MTGIVTWLSTYAAHVDGHHRAQLLAAADEIADLRAQVRELEPVGWQWLTTSRIRVKLAKDAEKGAWRRIYAKPYRVGD